MREKLRDVIEQERTEHECFVDGLCIMGTMPPGCPIDFYASLYEEIMLSTIGKTEQTDNFCVIVDAIVGLEQLFTVMTAYTCDAEKNDKNPNMLKINVSELYKLAGRPMSTGRELSHANEDEIRSALLEFHRLFPTARKALKYIAITNGQHPGRLVRVGFSTDADIIYELSIPNLNQLLAPNAKKGLFPVGAGDTVAAGILAAWQYFNFQKGHSNRFRLNIQLAQSLDSFRSRLISDGKITCLDDVDTVTAVAFGIACGSASCLKQENSIFDVEDALVLLERIRHS